MIILCCSDDTESSLEIYIPLWVKPLIKKYEWRNNE